MPDLNYSIDKNPIGLTSVTFGVGRRTCRGCTFLDARGYCPLLGCADHEHEDRLLVMAGVCTTDKCWLAVFAAFVFVIGLLVSDQNHIAASAHSTGVRHATSEVP